MKHEIEIYIASDPDGRVKFFLESPERKKTYASSICIEQWIGKEFHIPPSVNWRDLFPSFTFPTWQDQPVKAKLVLENER